MKHIFRFLLVFLVMAFSVAQGAAWLQYERCELQDDRYFDGDSFQVKALTGYTYVFRLYGVDCPETDTRYPARLEAQAAEFGVEVEELEKWGLEARRFVKKFLRKPFTVHTQKTKAGGQSKKNRYFAIVIGHDGQRLDEALIEAGLGRAFGMGAEWPERMTPERYIRKLHALESKAKRDDVGIWKDSTK